MTKEELFLLKLVYIISLLGALASLGGLLFIEIERGYVQSDELQMLENWEKIYAVGFIVCGTAFIISAVGRLTFSEFGTAIYNRYMAPKLQKLPLYAAGMVHKEPEAEPTLNRTAQGAHMTQKVVIAENFRDLFMPDFCRKDDIGINALEILQEELKKGTWNITDLGRIARMCFEANVQQPHYKYFNHWMKTFCENLGRADCPEKPDKKSYKIAKDSELLRTFSSIVRIGEKHYSDYKDRLA